METVVYGNVPEIYGKSDESQKRVHRVHGEKVHKEHGGKCEHREYRESEAIVTFGTAERFRREGVGAPVKV